MRKPVDTFKRLFRRLSLREQLLAVFFVAVMLVIWTGRLTDRLGAWNDGRRTATSDLEEQQMWLDRRDEIARDLRISLERVEPQRTIAAAELSGRIDDIARSVAISADIDPVRTTEDQIVNYHRLRIRLRGVSIDKVIAFMERLGAESPYINLEVLNLQSSRARPDQLNAVLQVTSFDLKPGATIQ